MAFLIERRLWLMWGQKMLNKCSFTFGKSGLIFWVFTPKSGRIWLERDRKCSSVHFRSPGALPVSSHLVQQASFFGSHTCPRCSFPSPDFSLSSNLMHDFFPFLVTFIYSIWVQDFFKILLSSEIRFSLKAFTDSCNCCAYSNQNLSCIVDNGTLLTLLHNLLEFFLDVMKACDIDISCLPWAYRTSTDSF